MAEKFDLVVIGSGPGGYVAAIRASQLGLKTAVVERDRVGGICLNWGCIPTKALLHSASLYSEIQRASDFGIDVQESAVNFANMVKHSRKVADQLSKGVEYLFRKNKITSIKGLGTLLAKNKVEVTDEKGARKTLDSKYILIATGARARSIPGIELDGKTIISSKEAMVLDNQPKSLVIIGAGAIGVEFAYFYASIGTRITLIEMMPQILPLEDSEAAQVVTRSFKKRGIDVLTNARVEKIDKRKTGVQVSVEAKGKHHELEAEKALLAIGVQGNVENLNLDGVGVKHEKGMISANKATFQTNIGAIYAIGDVIGPPWLAHVASAEGVAAVEHMAGEKPESIDYDNIPACTYCQPQVASMGMTEELARKAGYEVKVGKFPFRANGKSLAMGHTDGFAKLIFDARYGELLGVHIVGSEATEMLAELGVAKTLETTADEIFKTIHAHPTVSEVIKEAAEDAYDRVIHI
ncbi:dihydrolipoyl dehydrogenase [candidate division KSB1 bacterium]|nr:dihydrolipoyl dehydrogenase [candidate division KSB1 bacterium]